MRGVVFLFFAVFFLVDCLAVFRLAVFRFAVFFLVDRLAVFCLAVFFLVVFFLVDRFAVFRFAVFFLAVFSVVFFFFTICMAPDREGPDIRTIAFLRGAHTKKGFLYG